MTKRLQLLFDEIENSEVFADVGCDHGYIAEAVLKSGKSEKVIISDISEKSLQKAKTLLCKKHADRVKAVVADGFDGIDDKIDEALIAGMGGEEIAGILIRANNLPKRLILSPQHNSDKVRIALLNLGYYIKKDTSFSDGKLYYLIVAEKVMGQFAEISTNEKQVYTEDEIYFGRDNINTKNADFAAYVLSEIDKLNAIMAANPTDIPDTLKQKTERLRRVYGHISNL